MSKSKRLGAWLVLVLTCTCLHAQQAANTLTWHNDNNRTGANLSESILTPANVNSEDFGKVHFIDTDGVVDAQPLYVAGLKIAGTTRNVVFIATEHDSVYASDATTGATLWKKSLLKPGETTSDNHSCSQISPEIGVTSTPVIDLAKGPHGAIYVVNMAEDSGGHYHHRINALDLLTGTQLFGGPTEVKGTYPGTGDHHSGGNVVFEPGQYAERAGLLEWNGAIYTTWTSHCDNGLYTGWMIGYDATTLKQTAVLNFTPNGSEGAVWMSGAGPAAGQTKMYLLDANGTFDTTLNSTGFPVHGDLGNAALAIAQQDGKLYVSDYYATDTTVQQSNADIDLGSGGILLIPSPLTDGSGNNHLLAVGAGKDHNIYVIDRDHMGHYHPNGGSIYQVLPGALPNGEWSAPAFFDNKVYYGGVGDSIQAFSFANAKLGSTPVTRTAHAFPYPGTTPSVSSDGSSNGIVWAVSHSSPAHLYAYNAEDLSIDLYNSGEVPGRDYMGSVDHFITQTVANGRVYVPTQKGVAVFGLLAK